VSEYDVTQAYCCLTGCLVMTVLQLLEKNVITFVPITERKHCSKAK
jgi:hypothetical protein